VTEIEMAIPATADVSIMVSLIEAQCAAEGLQLMLKGTLAKYPGCIHWHFKRGSERGTLEITWWAKQRRFWFSIQAGRTGAWVEATQERLKKVLTKRLAASA
jgi:hypothetical protein